MLPRVSTHLHMCLIIIFFYSFRSPSFSVGPGWHFTALYVCDKWKEGKKRNSNEENQNLHSSLKMVFSQFQLNLLHQAPCSISVHLTPLMCDRPQLLSQSRASPTLWLSPSPRQIRHQNLRNWPASSGSRDKLWLRSSHTEDRKKSPGNNSKQSRCPWLRSPRIWFS